MLHRPLLIFLLFNKKCFEKIANSIDREKFKVVGQDGEEARTYEVLMHKALEK